MPVTTREYKPDRVSPPGDSLLSILEERGIAQADLARRMGRPAKTINEIIKGIAAITPETALELESVLGTPAQFWLNRESRYREFVARKEREEAAEKAMSWVRRFPLKAMAAKEWISEPRPSPQAVSEVFSFFGVASVEGWEQTWLTAEAQFRRSKTRQGDRQAIAAWLRRGEIEASKVRCEPFSSARFESVLDEAKALTIRPPAESQRRLIELCAGAGVALIFVPELPNVPVHAVTRWAATDKAVIQLSLYYKSDDHLWFSFFHEAAHVLSEKRRVVFLDDGAVDSDDEREADKYACDFLIPPDAFARFRRAGAFDAASVRAFAHAQGISPGIVVGRLQHDGLIPFSHLARLKHPLRWANE